MVSGHGPLESEDYVPLSGYVVARRGGLAAPPDGLLACAPAPLAGGGMAQGGQSPACIVNSGQKVSPPEVLLPGMVSMVGSGDECEPSGWVVTGVCPKCGHHLQMVKHGCGLITCPSCSRKWARRAAERSGARLFGAFMARASKHKPRHITFDLDECSWAAAKKKAADLGCTGGVLVIHPWRMKDKYRTMFEIMAEKTGRNRYDLAKESAIGMDAFEWSPHCHGLVFGKFTEVRRDSDVFLYRMIRRLNSQHEAEKSLMYLFGHTFIPQTKNGKCYRYIGICSPQKLKPSWTGTCLDSLKCPCCDAEMVEEGTNMLILYKRYVALGWHTVLRSSGMTKGAPPPVAPALG